MNVFLKLKLKKKLEGPMTAQNWMLIAFMAPMSWALVNIIDLWLATDIFKEEEEATAVIGVFGVLPLMSIFIWGLPQIDIFYGCWAVIAGILFMVFTFYYFKSLFVSDDVTMVSILLNLTGLAVPLMAALMTHERLSVMKYIGIAIVIIGSIIACSNGKILSEKLKMIAWPMTISVSAFSLSMLIEGEVYDHIGFHSGFMFFSFGLFLGGSFCYLRKSLREKKMFKPSALGCIGFVIAECINLIAIAFSHYAIKISPSVSYVAVIETTVPAFIMLFCLFTYRICRAFRIETRYKSVIESQLVGAEYKSMAIVIMALGIYLIYLKG